MNSKQLLDFHSQHFNDETIKQFKTSIQSNHSAVPPSSSTKNGLAVNLSHELVEMFRFSEEYKRQRHAQREEEQEEQEEPEEKEKQVFDGEQEKEIKDLENELEEKGTKFKDYPVWPVLPLKF
jgi:hypothetical protein